MSSWLEHVKKTMKMNPNAAFKDVLKMAKKTYKKGEHVVKYAVTGKKTRKHHKKSHGKTQKKHHKKHGKSARRHHKR